MGKQDNRDICDRDAKQLCTVIREEQAEEELARAGMGNNAAAACQEVQLNGCSEERPD